MFQPDLSLGVQFLLFLFTVSSNYHWLKKFKKHRWHLCEVGSKKHLEFCRLTRVCFSMAQILNQENTQPRGFFAHYPVWTTALSVSVGRKKTSNNCFVFRQAGVPPVYFAITADKHIFFKLSAAGHTTIWNLHWVNNYIYVCISRQWDDGDVLEDLFCSFCHSHLFIE